MIHKGLETLRERLTCLAARAAVIKEEKGATMVEYGLLVALVAVVVMATLSVLGVQINTMFCSVVKRLNSAATC